MVGDAVKAEVSEKGATTVPAHLFHDIVRKLPVGSQVVIEEKDNGITVKSGRSRFTLQTLHAARCHRHRGATPRG